MRLFLAMLWVYLQFVIVVFPDDTHLLFLLYTLTCLAYGFCLDFVIICINCLSNVKECKQLLGVTLSFLF